MNSSTNNKKQYINGGTIFALIITLGFTFIGIYIAFFASNPDLIGGLVFARHFFSFCPFDYL